MARTTIDTWNPEFFTQSPIFDSVREVSQAFTKLKQWPTLEQFSAEFSQRHIQSHGGMPIKPVEQGLTAEHFEDHYESRIFLKGELQTRLENWHDYFNATAWLQFPNTKSTLNALHYENSKNRIVGSNRSPLENAITLFDECGAIIVADDEKYLQLIQNHQWQELFINHREAFSTGNSQTHIQIYVFGHAMHEKALTPYLGMTTHSILALKSADFFTQRYCQQLNEIDKYMAALWQQKAISSSKHLQPYPLLGTPEWWRSEQDKHFYENKDYFREKKPRA